MVFTTPLWMGCQLLHHNASVPSAKNTAIQDPFHLTRLIDNHK